MDAIDRLEADVESHTNKCVKDYGGHLDDAEIAMVLRNIADRYDPGRTGGIHR